MAHMWYSAWRADHSGKTCIAPYKRNRKEMAEAMTEKEKEENDVFWECYDDFVDFIKTKTNVTVLQNPRVEADDLIARWIDKHPDQKHVINKHRQGSESTDNTTGQAVQRCQRSHNDTRGLVREERHTGHRQEIKSTQTRTRRGMDHIREEHEG